MTDTAKLKAEILTGPLAKDLAPLVAKGRDADIADILNAKGEVGAYVPVSPPEDKTLTESPADVLFGGSITADDVAQALRGSK